MPTHNNISKPSDPAAVTSDPRAAIADDGILTHLRVSIIATLVLAVICCGIYPAIVWGLSQVIFRDKANGSLIRNDKGTLIGSKLIGQSFSDARYFHGRPSAAGSNGYDATASAGSNLGPTSAKLINGTTKPSTLSTPSTAVPASPAAMQAASPPKHPAVEAIQSPTTAPATPPAVVVDYDGVKLRVLHYCDDNSLQFSASRDGKRIASDAFEKEFKHASGWDEVKLIVAFNDGDHPLTLTSAESIPADAVTASASGLDPHISRENAKLQKPRVAAARHIKEEVVQKLIDDNTDGASLGFLGESGVNVLLLNIALGKRYPVPAAPPKTDPTSATVPAVTTPAK